MDDPQQKKCISIACAFPGCTSVAVHVVEWRSYAFQLCTRHLPIDVLDAQDRLSELEEGVDYWMDQLGPSKKAPPADRCVEAAIESDAFWQNIIDKLATEGAPE